MLPYLTLFLVVNLYRMSFEETFRFEFFTTTQAGKFSSLLLCCRMFGLDVGKFHYPTQKYKLKNFNCIGYSGDDFGPRACCRLRRIVKNTNLLFNCLSHLMHWYNPRTCLLDIWCRSASWFKKVKEHFSSFPP